MKKIIQGTNPTQNSSTGNIIDYIKTKNWVYGDGPKPRTMVHDLPILENNINKPVVTPNKMSKADEYNAYFNKESPKYYKNVRDPSKSRDSSTVDIVWDLPSDIEEDVYGTYLRLLKGGDLTPGTSFEEFEKNYSNYDAKLIKKKNDLKEMRLSNAIAKIDDAMSGIASVMNLGGGGPVKNRPREPKIKKLNLADYFKVGMRIVELTPAERELVSELVKKSLNPKIKEN